MATLGDVFKELNTLKAPGTGRTGHTVRDPIQAATGSRSLPSCTGGRNGRNVCEKSPPGFANGAEDC